MNVPLVFIVMGVAGSGKSTVAQSLAQRLGLDYLEGDQFHSTENIVKMRDGIPLTDEDRWPWIEKMNTYIRLELQRGDGVTLASSALKKIYREKLTAGLPGAKFIYLKGSKELIVGRMAARVGHFMPLALLDSQFAILEEPQADENAITVSIDATPGEIIGEIITDLQI